ncbi:MAG: PIG-L family deacetylase [Bdellovibrionota bacterium]
MSSPKYDLLVVAHPDDETLFFGGLLLRRRTRPWTVICATDGNADGMGQVRKKQFETACKKLGVKSALWWSYPDRYEDRLPVDDLVTRLKALPKPHTIFTHGIIGEYGHPHHQDVSYAVHAAFAGHPRVHASAYNAFPDFRIALTEKEFRLKAKILTEIYGSETTKFLNLLTASSTEGFLTLKPKEIEALYAFHAKGQALDSKALTRYAWLEDFLKSRPGATRQF